MNIFKHLKKALEDKKVVSYYRVSKESKTMCLRQRFACDRFIEQNSYTKEEEFYETISGTVKLDDRDVLIECITYCIKHKIKKIILTECDRLSRNYNTYKDILKMVQPFGIHFIFTLDELSTKNKKDLEKIEDKILFAEKELRKIHTRLNSGREKYIANGGKLGRKKGSVKTNNQKREEYADVLRILFEENRSIRKTAELTNTSVATVQRLKNEFKGEYGYRMTTHN